METVEQDGGFNIILDHDTDTNDIDIRQYRWGLSCLIPVKKSNDRAFVRAFCRVAGLPEPWAGEGEGR